MDTVASQPTPHSYLVITLLLLLFVGTTTWILFDILLEEKLFAYLKLMGHNISNPIAVMSRL